jgi:pimeloyl-ACP methyl ester carboxylesterase
MLAYERAGSGPPLVLLHGIGHRRQAWSAVTGLLTPHRDVIAVDLPGHGQSPPFDLHQRTPTDRLTEERLGLLDHLGLGRPHLAGNSLGARIALEAAAVGRAASVTALAPAGFWRSHLELAYAKGVFRGMQVLGRWLKPVTPKLASSTAGRAVLCGTIVCRPSLMSPQQVTGDEGVPGVPAGHERDPGHGHPVRRPDTRRRAGHDRLGHP